MEPLVNQPRRYMQTRFMLKMVARVSATSAVPTPKRRSIAGYKVDAVSRSSPFPEGIDQLPFLDCHWT